MTRPSPPHPQQQSPFFSVLAPELRIQIYRHLAGGATQYVNLQRTVTHQWSCFHAANYIQQANGDDDDDDDAVDEVDEGGGGASVYASAVPFHCHRVLTPLGDIPLENSSSSPSSTTTEPGRQQRNSLGDRLAALLCCRRMSDEVAAHAALPRSLVVDADIKNIATFLAADAAVLPPPAVRAALEVLEIRYAGPASDAYILARLPRWASCCADRGGGGHGEGALRKETFPRLRSFTVTLVGPADPRPPPDDWVGMGGRGEEDGEEEGVNE
ncbi:hypothetical protein F4778DRAFT_779470 [Xylariomycetidae sp. FL2044]|nr:hypothetical protein F4778DRAFT_779470 [Xylariomycetidae sp. FL2044]